MVLVSRKIEGCSSNGVTVLLLHAGRQGRGVPNAAIKIMFLALFSAVLFFTVTGCEGSYHLSAMFHKVQQLKEGDPVLMEGIQVGRVDRITLDPRQGRLIVSMKIKRSVVVKTDSIAVIKATISAGTNVVVLEGGSDLAPAAADHAFLMIRELPSH